MAVLLASAAGAERPQGVELVGEGMTLAEGAARLEAQSGTPVELAPGIDALRVSLALSDVPLEEALTTIADRLHLSVEKLSDGGYRLTWQEGRPPRRLLMCQHQRPTRLARWFEKSWIQPPEPGAEPLPEWSAGVRTVRVRWDALGKVSYWASPDDRAPLALPPGVDSVVADDRQSALLVTGNPAGAAELRDLLTRYDLPTCGAVELAISLLQGKAAEPDAVVQRLGLSGYPVLLQQGWPMPLLGRDERRWTDGLATFPAWQRIDLPPIGLEPGEPLVLDLEWSRFTTTYAEVSGGPYATRVLKTEPVERGYNCLLLPWYPTADPADGCEVWLTGSVTGRWRLPPSGSGWTVPAGGVFGLRVLRDIAPDPFRWPLDPPGEPPRPTDLHELLVLLRPTFVPTI